ncbi:penicillin-binding protein [Floricoccus tropicus]|uniref:Penicillin-binding protein n=1 Tax=Floricoccus tropicus TaxID=1859473 RepID=A0A1E8GQB0_9LACT|nr:transglycosylase domain-containing protein [Floricoccus tropicus]OFI50450.1 penicillin-binding protein [Floricoccus tropicus]
MNSSDGKSKNQNKLIRKILKYALIIFLSLFILAFLVGSILFISYAKSAPKLEVSKLESKPSSIIYDKDGKVIADLGEEKRDLVATNEIPITLVDAITSIEDHRFFNHRGVDPVRIIGSVVHNAKNDTTQGGSTLTQQLIKLSYFSTSKTDQNVRRKAQEAWLSVQLERKESKEEILTQYINKVFMANGYYGMRTASKAYYGKELKDLSLPQIALLAGMPQSPNGYNPYTNPDGAKKRRDTVLSSMLEYEKISKDDYNKAVETPIDSGLKQLTPSITIPAFADNFLKQVIEQVKEDTGQDITAGGLKVYTTLDSNAQRYLYELVNSNDYVAYPDEDMQVASTIVDVKTGAVTAQIGARKQDPGTVFGNNQAVNTDRDWGSTMKPLVDYAPAYEYGTYKSTGTYILDTPYYYPDGNILYDWDRKYMGQMTVRNALVLSRNIPAAKTLEAVGLENSQNFLEKMNFNFEPSLQYSNAISSNNRGSGKKWGASSEKMAAAYAALASGGMYTKPYYVTKIVDDEGKETNLKPEKVRAMKETSAYVVTDMLKGVITGGTMTNGYIPGLIQAGKTGTSNYDDTAAETILEDYGQYIPSGGTIAPDENFVGYTTNYSMAVWTGYKNRMIPLYGQKLEIALDVYREMMKYLSQNVPNNDWEMPEGVYRNGSELTVAD